METMQTRSNTWNGLAGQKWGRTSPTGSTPCWRLRPTRSSPLAALKPGEAVMDIGCGAGALPCAPQAVVGAGQGALGVVRLRSAHRTSPGPALQEADPALPRFETRRCQRVPTRARILTDIVISRFGGHVL